MRKNYFIVLAAIIVADILLSAVFYFVSPAPASAQTTTGNLENVQEGVQVIEQPLGLPATDIRLIVANIIRYALGLLGLITLVMMLYGGFMWMTAGGNEEQIAQAKKILVNAAIGLAIILLAYAIVIFVMRMLGIGEGGGGGAGGGGGLGAPLTENFSGSGALGGIIKDHYPVRDQTDVARNTKIVVTFRRPVLPESFIEDTNSTTVLGDCKMPVQDWNTDCDHVKTVAGGLLGDQYVNIKDASSSASIAGAVALVASTTINGVPGIYTVVIKPITDANSPNGGYLGNSTENVSYKVRLGPGILLNDPANGNPSAFQTRMAGNDYYEWQFTCGTSIDTSPPTVTNVFPQADVTEVRNSVIQVNFSEPMDPIGVQGDFTTDPNDASGYVLANGNIYIKIDNSQIPAGSFNLTNGYRTLEFTPSQECGVNACGGKIYCLPVCNKAGASCIVDNYTLLLRAGRTLNTASFEAQPFSGVMDLAGNALDGNADTRVQVAPTAPPVFDTHKTPDNYYWGFKINDEIDSTPPYIHDVVPGLNAANTPRDQEWSITFSKRMRVEPMYDITMSEKPAHAIPLWHVPSVYFRDDNITYTRIGHGPFLDGLRQYYFPIVTSTVEDVHFNCFYPGKGPNQNVAQGTQISPTCSSTAPQQCCEVVNTANADFCCNGQVNASSSQTQACLNYLESISP